jgi:hypothetical protein
MSHNVDRIRILKLDAWMTAGDLHDIMDRLGNDLPEINFLDSLEAAYRRVAPGTKIQIRDFAWSGTGSGRSMDILFGEIVPKIKGVIDAILVWEDGELTGLRIRDGKATKPKVKVGLED